MLAPSKEVARWSRGYRNCPGCWDYCCGGPSRSDSSFMSHGRCRCAARRVPRSSPLTAHPAVHIDTATWSAIESVAGRHHRISHPLLLTRPTGSRAQHVKKRRCRATRETTDSLMMLSSLQSLGTVQVQASTLPCGSTPTSIGRTCRKRVCWPFRSPRNLRIGPIIGLGALGSGSPVGGHGIYLRKSLEARQCQPCQDQGGNEVRAEIPGGVHACLRVGLGPGGCSG